MFYSLYEADLDNEKLSLYNIVSSSATTREVSRVWDDMNNSYLATNGIRGP